MTFVMDMKRSIEMRRIDEIRERYNNSGLTNDQYDKLTKREIAQMRVDIKRMLCELDRITKERDTAAREIMTAIEYSICSVCKRAGIGLNKHPCKSCWVINALKNTSLNFEWSGDGK